MYACLCVFFFCFLVATSKAGNAELKEGERLRSLSFFFFRCTSPISLRYTTAGFFFFF